MIQVWREQYDFRRKCPIGLCALMYFFLPPGVNLHFMGILHLVTQKKCAAGCKMCTYAQHLLLTIYPFEVIKFYSRILLFTIMSQRQHFLYNFLYLCNCIGYMWKVMSWIQMRVCTSFLEKLKLNILRNLMYQLSIYCICLLCFM